MAFKKLLSDTAIYGISSILARLLNYALVPLHTGSFPEGNYGIIAQFYAYAAILNTLYSYGMETTFFRFASKKELNKEEVYQQSLTMSITTSIVFSGLLILFSSPIVRLMGFEGSEEYLIWFAIILATDAIVAIPFAKLRLENRAKYFAGVKTTNILINIGLNAFYFLLLKRIVEGDILQEYRSMAEYLYDPSIGLGYAFLANMVANLLIIPMLAPILKKWRPMFNKKMFLNMMPYALPILVSSLAYSLNEVLDRHLLKHLLADGFYEGKSANEAIGVYSACYKLSIFITLAIQAYKFAAEPFFFSKAEDKKSPQLFARITQYFVLACCVMFITVSLNMDWISTIFLRQESYRVGLAVVPILLLANLFLGLYYNLAVWFKVSDKTYFGAIISSLGALVTIIGNYLLIPILGYIGSAITTLACYASICFLCYLFGQKHYPIPYNIKKIGGYILSASLLVWGTLLLANLPLGWLQFFIHNGLILGYLAILFLIEKKSFTKSIY